MPGEKEEQLRVSTHYYCLTKFYKSMQVSSLEGVRLYATDSRFRFYYSVSLIFEGRYPEAIRELESLLDRKSFDTRGSSVSLAAQLAVIHVQRKNRSTDAEAIQQLESSVREQRKMASDEALYYASLFLLFVQKYDKATEYVDKLLSKNPSYKQGKVIKGWLDIFHKQKDDRTKSSGKFFNEAVAEGDIEALLGKSMLAMKKGLYQKSLDLLKTLTSNYPSFAPALVEKMKACLYLKDWDAVLDCSQKTLSLDRHSVEGLRYAILFSLVWNRQQEEQIISKLSDLATSLELREPKSSRLYLQSTKLFSRLSEKRVEIIRKTLSLTDRASFIDQSCQLAAYNEMGQQNLLLGRVKDAQRHFKNANKINPSDMDSLVGLLHCSVLEDPNAPETLENLEALEQLNTAAGGLTPTLKYLCALTGEKRGKSQSEIFQYLDSLLESYFDDLGWNGSLSLDLYTKLSPDFVLDVVRLYITFAPFDPLNPGQPVSHALKQSMAFLDPLLASCPAHREPLFLMAKVKFLSGNWNPSLALLEKCLEKEDSFSEGYLLKARILLHMQQYKASQQALDIAVSHDFQIRDNIEYQLVKGSLLKYERKYEEAISILNQALEAITSSTRKQSASRTSRGKRTPRCHQDDQVKIAVCLLLSQLHDLLDNSIESEKLLNDLDEEFTDTFFEGRIRLTKASSAITKGSLDQALIILKSLGEDEVSKDYFIESRRMMADIYLKFRKERRLYAACYQEIADRTGTKAAQLMLGDAYMHILEPEKAVEIYENCLKKNPKDAILIRKVGQALVTVHLFDKAVTYYKASIKTSTSFEDILLTITLKHDLARLLFRLKRHNEAKDLIKSALEQIEDRPDSRGNIDVLAQEAKLIFLMSEIQGVVEKQDAVIASLKRAYSLQTKVVRRISFEKPDCLEEDKNFLVKIGTQLAKFLSLSPMNYGSAINYYKELLNWDPKNVKILSSLANLELLMNNFDTAQSYTSMILKHAPDDDVSVLMMTDMMISRHDLDGAFDQLVQLLERKPTNFAACARFVDVARRLGRLQVVGQHLNRVLKTQPAVESDTKYHYCRGMYEKAVQDSVNAIQSLYRSRGDPELGKASLIAMTEIYLNPDNEIIGGNVLESQASTDERVTVSEGNVKTATKILEDLLRNYGECQEYHFYKAFSFIVRRHRHDIDQAMSLFNDMLKDSPDNSFALFGLATGHSVSGSYQKAKATLKRLFSQEWKVVNTEVFEKASLLMADIYLQSNKSDAARTYIEKCLSNNRSSIRAFELLAFACERENSLPDAVEYYKTAFDLCLRKNPVIGYKLAYNCLKMKQYSMAVDVGREVLDLYPDYPKVEQEIVKKALNARLQMF